MKYLLLAMMATMGFAQDLTITLKLSDKRLAALDAWAATIQDPLYPPVQIAAVDIGTATAKVALGAKLPATPFQLTIVGSDGAGNPILEVVRVTSIKTVEKPGNQELTLVRGIRGTTARAWPSNTTAIVPRFGSKEAALQRVLRDSIATLVGRFDPDVAAAEAALKNAQDALNALKDGSNQ